MCIKVHLLHRYFILQIMHDEVSETENIRKNLSIERMIIEGCDILLDVNQTFVRQGQSSLLTNTVQDRPAIPRLELTRCWI